MCLSWSETRWCVIQPLPWSSLACCNRLCSGVLVTWLLQQYRASEYIYISNSEFQTSKFEMHYNKIWHSAFNCQGPARALMADLSGNFTANSLQVLPAIVSKRPVLVVVVISVELATWSATLFFFAQQVVMALVQLIQSFVLGWRWEISLGTPLVPQIIGTSKSCTLVHNFYPAENVDPA